MIKLIMGLLRRAVLAAGLVLAAPAVAQAAGSVLAECGASAGFTYYLPGGAVPEDKAGWAEDRISGGSIQLVVHGDEASWNLDIIYRSAGGTGGSLTAEGFTVSPITQPPAPVLVIALHADGSALDHYLFELNADNKPVRVIWGSVRSGTLVQKSSLMVAECQPGG